MIAAILSVGDELVAGEVTDTNGTWLARELADVGIRIGLMATTPDDPSTIASFVSWARSEHDVVIVSGGLGGTPDDVTRDGIADALGVPVVLDEERARALHAVGGHAAVFAQEWCRLPIGSRVIAGAVGGAPPFVVDNVYVFPGAPVEMRAAFEAIRSELPRGSARLSWRGTYRTTEDKIADLLANAQHLHPGVRIGSYARAAAHGDEVDLVIRSPEPRSLERAVAHLAAGLSAQAIAPVD